MLDARRLSLLHELSVHGTIAAAAESLHLTAPAISQQLATLEREAGLPLLEKDGRRLKLTPAGQILVAHAEVIVGDLAAAEADLAVLRGGERGVARVGAFPSAARVLLPAVWTHLAAGHDRAARLHLVEQEPEIAVPALQRREIDIAVVHGYTLLPRDLPPGFEQHQLLNEPVLLAVPTALVESMAPLAAPGGAVELSQFGSASWLVPGPETSCLEMIRRACGAAGFVPDVVAQASDFSVLVALVAAGAGVALVPRMALPSAHTDERVTLFRPAQPVTRQVYALTRSGTARRPDIRPVLDLLVESAQAVG